MDFFCFGFLKHEMSRNKMPIKANNELIFENKYPSNWSGHAYTHMYACTYINMYIRNDIQSCFCFVKPNTI